MSRTFITGIAIAAFIAVELLAVQPTEAQRLRNLLRRNNNNGCNNCCQGCEIPAQSAGSISEGYVESSSVPSQGMIVSEAPITSSYDGSYGGEMISSPMEAYSAPMQTYSSPMETYSSPIAQTPFESPAFVDSQPIAQSQAYVEPQPYVEAYNEPQPTFSMAQASPYVEGMPTSEYPLESGSINSYVTPASFGVTEGCVGCGATAEQASWTYDSGSVQGQFIGDTNVMQGGIIEGGIVNGGMVDSGFVGGGSQGQVLGCATGDCGGQVFDSGQIINGGQIISGNPGITSADIVNENAVYGGSAGFVGGSAEQIISSEIISETPINATDSKGTPEVESPAESVPTEAPDEVPEAPEDGKEA